MMRKILLLSLVLAFSFSGVLYAAGGWNGYQTVKVTSAGKTILAPDPAIVVKGKTFVSLSILKQIGLTVSGNTKSINVELPKPKPTPTQQEKPRQPALQPLTLDQVKALSNAVAIVYALDDQGKRTAQGSGFVINSHGLLITAYHVAEVDGQMQQLEVQLNGKTYFVPAGVNVFADKQKDVFGVYLQDPDPFPYFQVSSELPKSFEDAYIIGNPKGERNVVTEGSITAAFRSEERIFVNGYFNAKPGSSGGPVLNQYGQVVGVITDGFDGGISFSTSILEAKALYEQTFR